MLKKKGGAGGAPGHTGPMFGNLDMPSPQKGASKQ